jgi:myosin heavy subunit
VHHYAGAVVYTINGFLETNRNAASLGLVEMIRTSKLSLAKTIFAHAEATSDRKGGGGFANRRGPAKKSFFFSRKNRGTKKAPNKNKGKRAATLGSEFRVSLEELMAKLQRSTPQFIRYDTHSLATV